jgi:drug/metabolite transporter (DMT)-like permease
MFKVLKLQQKDKANLMLWLTAAIWGFAFVAQRAGMKYIGPFTFNGIRFLLGGLSLVPLLMIQRKQLEFKGKLYLKNGIFAGIILFIASSLQQMGMVWTSAGKAGFITGLYIIIIPLIGILIGQKISRFIWIGALLSICGLFLLTINDSLSISKGDSIVLTGAFFWAFHVQIISKFVRDTPPLLLAFVQFIVCGMLSIVTAMLTETIAFSSILNASLPILYGGIMSVGIAYTLQVISQKHVSPSYAGIVLSFETVFAVIGGWILLNESMNTKDLAGCLLMLGGMILVQRYGSDSQSK